MGNVYRDRKGEYWVACWAPERTRNEVGAAGGNPDESTRTRLIQDNGDSTISFTRMPSSVPSGSYDWQGRPIADMTSPTASLLPMSIRTGRKTDTLTLQATPG